MNRRKVMSTLGLGAAGLALAEGTALAGLQEPKHEHGHHHGHHDGHLKLMGECAVACNETAAHCLEQICAKEGDLESHAKVHQMAMDCQAFCVLSATMMARHSPLSKFAHEANAEACRACAEACDAHKGDDPMVKHCGEMCRECEKACREASRQGHDHKA